MMSRNKQSDSKELEERIERIRLQNEKINKRYLEVEADKKKAKDHNAMVQVTVVPEDWTCHRNMMEVPTKRGDNGERNAKRDELDGRQNDGQGNQARRAGRGGRGGSGRGQGRGGPRRPVNQERDDEWRREREQIDQDRINRQKTSNGEWKREWDSEKTENSRSGLPQPHEPQGTPSPQSRGGHSGRPHPEPGRSSHPSAVSPRGQHPAVQGRSPPNQQFSRGNAPPQHLGRPIVKTSPHETSGQIPPASPAVETADRPRRAATPERPPHVDDEEAPSPRTLTLAPGDDRDTTRIAVTISNSPRRLTQPGRTADVVATTGSGFTESLWLVSNTEIHAVSPSKRGTMQLRGAEPKSDESGPESESDESWEDVTSSAENLTDPACLDDIKVTVGAAGDARDSSFAVSSAGGGAAQETVQVAVQEAVLKAVQEAVLVAVQGPVQGEAQAAAQEAVLVAVQGPVQGEAQAAAQEAVQEVVQRAVLAAVQGEAQEAVQGTVQEEAQESVQGAVLPAIQGETEEVILAAIQGEAQEAVQEAVPGAVLAAVQGAVLVAVQEAVQGAVQEAVKGAVQGAVLAAAQGAEDARHDEDEDKDDVERQTSRLLASTGEREVAAEATEETASSSEPGNDSDEFHLAESDVEQVEDASLPPEQSEEVAGDDREECSVLSRDKSLLELSEEDVIKTELSVGGAAGEMNVTNVVKSVVEKDTVILVIEPAVTVVGNKEDVDMSADVDQGIVLLSEDVPIKLITETNIENKEQHTDRPTNSDESEVGNINRGVIEPA